MRIGQLVNGTSIVFETAEGHDTLDFFHIELERHDVLDAQGAPCKSRIDPWVETCVPMLSFGGRRGELRRGCAARYRWWSTGANRSTSSATRSRSAACSWRKRRNQGSRGECANGEYSPSGKALSCRRAVYRWTIGPYRVGGRIWARPW